MTENSSPSLFNRASGLLMHISSIPGYWGMGDLGPSTRKFIDQLAENSQKLWQILPLTIPDMTGSPYSSYSAFAANIQFISPEDLCREGLCKEQSIAKLESDHPRQPKNRKTELLRIIFEQLEIPAELQREFLEFQQKNAYWLRDFCLFSTLMDYFGPLWIEWPDAYRDRYHDALHEWENRHRDEMNLYAFGQFIFDHQWQQLKNYAAAKAVKIIGDIPIFVAHNSVDVWAHREIFKLDDKGFPTVVAGVPPDIFSETGQLWGNPHYNWEALEINGFEWWFQRLGHILHQVDYVRLDHFRGFEAAWEVEAHEKTAENGRWVKGRPHAFFNAFNEKFAKAPVIAEDLGIITDEVRAIMKKYGFPGMKILQFALDSGPENDFLPQNYEDSNCIVYTGTHDNNTLRGWYENASDHEKQNLSELLGIEGDDINWKMIRSAMESIAVWAILPAQDILELGNEARMNFPSTTEGNWRWQLDDLNSLEPALNKLSGLNRKTHR